MVEGRRAAADHGLQLSGAKLQRELIERLADHEIAGLGFGTGFAHKRLPAALVNAARKRDFPLFEVPYELPFIAITERAFAQLLDERYEMLQRNMAGDVLAEALTGRLYPEELQARLRPFGIGEQVAVLAFALRDPSAAAAPLEAGLERASDARRLVAIRAGLLCAVSTPAAAWIRSRSRASCAASCGALRRGAGGGEPRGADALAAAELPRGALRAGGGAAAERRRAPEVPPTRPRRLPAAALAAGRRRADLLLPRRARPGRSRARASTATSCCARWTCSSSTTATGRRRRARSTATATRCATASAASSS